MGILGVDLNNINLVDANYDEDDPKTVIRVRFLVDISSLKNAKHLRKI